MSVTDGMILIAGAGNHIMRDEGIGISALNVLQKQKLPENVILMEVGTDVFKIMSENRVFKRIYIIDAMQKHSLPGTIYKLAIEETNADEEEKNAHQISLVGALKLMKSLLPQFHKSEIILFGMEPESIEFGSSLSSSVLAQLPNLVDMILEEINTN